MSIFIWFSNLSKYLIPKNIAICLFCFLVFRCFLFFTLPVQDIIGWIADDSFYYQKLACNYLADGSKWSFDMHSSTSGFHILYAYLLFVFNWVFGCSHWRIVFLCIGLLASTSIALSFYFTMSLVKRHFTPNSHLPVAYVYFSPLVFLQVTSLMESWISILLSSGTFLFLFFGFSPNGYSNCKYARFKSAFVASPLKFIVIYLLGLCATLSRSDFIIGAAALAISSFIFNSKKDYHNLFKLDFLDLLRKSLILFFGSVCGYMLVALHSFFISGSYVQGSAATKFYWSSVEGHSPLQFILTLFRLLLYPLRIFTNEQELVFHVKQILLLMSPRILLLSFIILVLLIIAAFKFLPYFRGVFRSFLIYKFSPPGLFMLVSSFTVILSYILFYSFNSRAQQPWYICQVIVPLSIVFSYLLARLFSESRLANKSSLFVVFLLFSGMQGVWFSMWPSQLGLLNAGKYLSKHRLSGSVGSWNAGTISFFSQQPIVNLDGLVNNDIINYLDDSSLYKYINSRKIHYIADFEAMFLNPEFPRRGGYSKGHLQRCVKKLWQIDGISPAMLDPFRFYGTNVYLYRVDQACLGKI